MTDKTDILLQVMEKIGSPLISSVNDVSARLHTSKGQKAGGESDNLNDEAEKIAGLLNKSVQLALSTSELFEIPEEEEKADSLRLALTAMAGPLLANHYRMTTKIPEDADLKRFKSTFNAVMTFADSFDVAADATARLDQIDKDFYPADKTQIHILYLQAMVPVLNAVASFSFGHQENKLVKEVTDTLLKRTRDIREEIVSDANEKKSAQCDLALLRALSIIYSQCHFSEMARLMSLPADKREKEPGTLDPVWKAFEARASLLKILGQESLVSSSDEAGKFSPAKPQVKELADRQEKTTPSNNSEKPSPDTESPPSQETENTNAQEELAQNAQGDTGSKENVDNSEVSGKQDSDNANPMAFFKKSKGSD